MIFRVRINVKLENKVSKLLSREDERVPEESLVLCCGPFYVLRRDLQESPCVFILSQTSRFFPFTYRYYIFK